MGNVYSISRCEDCGEPTVQTASGKFTVHRGQNVQKAVTLIEEIGIEEAAKQFCGYCGGFVGYLDECDCGNYTRQVINTPTNVA